MTNLRKIRKLRGVSQEQLAKDTGISQGQISAWETGKRVNASVNNIMKVCEALRCSADELLRKGDDNEKLYG
jgi:transcriptional regulator with XRE-family HTH domain